MGKTARVRRTRKVRVSRPTSGTTSLMKPATCNCFLSWDQEALAATSTFQPATANGPGDVNGNFDEFDQAAIKQFIDSKTRPITERPDQNSAELYQPLGDGEIRVLELHAGQPGTLLHG